MSSGKDGDKDVFRIPKDSAAAAADGPALMPLAVFESLQDVVYVAHEYPFEVGALILPRMSQQN